MFNEETLNGYIEGDGYYKKDTIHIKTTSKTLVLQTQMLAAIYNYEFFHLNLFLLSFSSPANIIFNLT